MKGEAYEKASQPPNECENVATGLHPRAENQRKNAEGRYTSVSAVLFQVRDLAAATCGEPHVAPSWLIAKRSLGAMLAKNPELAERAPAIAIEYCGDWDPEDGITEKTFQTSRALDREWSCFGDVCLKEYLEACREEEEQGCSDSFQELHEEQCRVQNEADAKNFVSFAKEGSCVNPDGDEPCMYPDCDECSAKCSEAWKK